MRNAFSQTARIPRVAKATAILLSSMLLMTVSPANAMRCGVNLISKGAYKEEVLAKCGQPYSYSDRYWLYRKNNTVYRLNFNSKNQIRRIKSEIRY